MRHVYALTGLLIAGVLMMLPVLGLTNASGAAPGFTGGPGDFGVCQVCHSSYEVNEGTGSVSVAVPEAFIPGGVYELTISVDNTTEPVGDDPVQGFQVSVQDAAGNHVGELFIIDPQNTAHSTGSVDYVTHTSAGRFEDTWTVQWVAPPIEEAPELVTVYVAGNAAAGNGAPSEDYIYTSTSSIPRKDVSADSPVLPGVFALDAIYPNPVTESGTVRLVLDRAMPVTLTVYDGLGRVVQGFEAGLLGSGDQEIGFRTSAFGPGIYFLEASTPEGSLVRPFTVVR